MEEERSLLPGSLPLPLALGGQPERRIGQPDTFLESETQALLQQDSQNPGVGRDLLPGVHEKSHPESRYRLRLAARDVRKDRPKIKTSVVICVQGCPNRDTQNPDIGGGLLPGVAKKRHPESRYRS